MATKKEDGPVYYVTGPKQLVDCVPTQGGSYVTKAHGEAINVAPENVERWLVKGLIGTEKPEAD